MDAADGIMEPVAGGQRDPRFQLERRGRKKDGVITCTR